MMNALGDLCGQLILGRPKSHTLTHIKLLFCPFVLQGKGIICGYYEKNPKNFRPPPLP